MLLSWIGAIPIRLTNYKLTLSKGGVPISKKTTKTDRLFVYGIFLSERNRKSYGMENPQYATVLDYATFGGAIVQAQKIEQAGLSLTGLTVDIPQTSWPSLDALEAGYRRSVVTTTDGEQVYMYTA